MSDLLRWRNATHSDRAALQLFTCVQPRQLGSAWRKRVPHSRPWEMDVQGFVRSMLPPARDGELMLLGEDQLGIAAVAWATQVSGPGDVFVNVAAVSLRCRGKHGIHADSLLEELRQRLLGLADAAGERQLLLTANVDPRNNASKHMLTRFGVGLLKDFGDMEQWGVNFPTPRLDD